MYSGQSGRQQQSGYLLLVLLISITLLSIAAAAAAPSIAQQIRRDREEEMIRRGKQYAEAVKRYYTKFHRYPANIDQLMDTNGIRFLRKRYVDPISGKDDWKLVHQGEATIPNFQFGAGPGIPGGQTPAQLGSSPSGMASVNPGTTGAGVTTGVAGATGATTSIGTNYSGTTTSTGTTTGAPGTGTTTGNVAGATVSVRPGVGGIVVAELISNVGNTAGQPGNGQSDQSTNQTGANITTSTTGTSNTSNTGNNSTFMGSQSAPAGGGTSSPFGGTQSGSSFGGSQSATTFGGSQPTTGVGGASPFATSFGAGQQIGGGAIIGVASTSTQQSIREFNGKDHYNEWAFIYDPRLDTRTPGQPGAGGGIGTPIAPGQNAGAPLMQPTTGTTNQGTTPPPSNPQTTSQPPL